MNERDHGPVVELLPGYVLGALDPDEARLVEAYLAAHPEAQREVEELQETLGLLAFAAPPLAPPPSAKAALLDRIERMTPPPAGGASSPPTGNPLTPALPEPLSLRRQQAGPVPLARRWRVAFAAVAAALIVALVGWNVNLQRQIGMVEREVTSLNTQISAQSETVALGRLVSERQFAHPLTSSTVSSYGSSGPAGYLYADPGGAVGLMNCYWMPTLADDRLYQVWLVRADGERESGGTFTVDDRGNASVVIRASASFNTYTSVGVTTEPLPGSSGPTTPRVVWADLK